LLELIVVIGIIGVLIGILLPTMRGVRERAKGVQCAAQLRSLGQAFYNYAAQSAGVLPPWSSWHNVGGDGTGDDDAGPGWTEILAPWYAPPTSKVYNCPGFPEDFPINYFLSARWLHHTDRRSLTLAQIRTSSHFVLSGDCTGPTLYPEPFGSTFHTKTDCDKDDAVDPCLKFATDVTGGQGIHHGGLNVLFGDGHVGWYKKFDPQEITFHPTKMQAWDDVSGD
jgi:prepilin-type processing-associated H-X9-DG protein